MDLTTGNRLYFTLDDSKEDKNRQPIKLADAPRLNSADHKKGIFWTVNKFSGATNLISDCTELCYWFADLDNFQMPLKEVIYASGIYPSLVVKTKSGMHIYWKCEAATMGNYSLLNRRLTAKFSTAPSVYDVARILRVPGYNHWKQPDDPFLCHTLWEADVSYTEEQIFSVCGKAHPAENKEHEHYQVELKQLSSGDKFFSWLEQQNQMDLLKHLSGKASVNFEHYSFKHIGKGKHHIFVNGKEANCWIDSGGRIGSQAGGGPLVYSWLRYFGNSKARAVELLKQEFAQWT